MAGGRPRRRGLLLLLLLPLVAGCGRHRLAVAVEQGTPVTLSPGQAYHFADHFRGAALSSGLDPDVDGRARVTLGGAHEPVLCAAAPSRFRQRLTVPAGAQFRTAFGLGPGSAGRARFAVTVRQRKKASVIVSGEADRWGGGRTANWTPVTVPLPAGEIEMELAVAAPRPSAGPSQPVSPLWVDPTVFAPSAEARPSIVLVVLDALRADHLGCYGYGRDTTPSLDRLASRSAVFTDVTSQATWTYASLRGLLSSTHQFLGEQHEAILSKPVPMPASLPGTLRAAGYDTLACVGGGYLDPQFGFDTGFDWYWSPPTATPMLPDQLAVVKERLARSTQAPFFLFLHTFETHHYREGWGHGLSRFDHGYRGRLTDRKVLREAVRPYAPRPPADELQYLQDLYDGEIRHTDEHLRRFLDWLRAQPWGKNTIVVITADHGESFGEHGVVSHGGAPYREVARVPLIISLPGDRPRGRKISQPVSLLDLAPTLLALAGSAAPREMLGRSLVPLMEGRPRREGPIFCGGRATTMVREGKLWYVSWQGARPEELFDVERDPEQRRSIARSSPREVEQMRTALAGLAAQGERGYRLVVTGKWAATLVVELRSSTGFAYLEAPTRREKHAVEVHRESGGAERARVILTPDGAPHVVLFEPVGADAAVSVTARVGRTPLRAAQFHLGERGTSPEQLPLTLHPGDRRLAAPDGGPRLPEDGSGEIWLWAPPRPPAAAPAPRSELSEGVRKQLKSLGYMH